MITAIDKNTALVIIDLQKGMLMMKLGVVLDNVLANTARLVEAFRKANLPVVIISVNPVGAPGGNLRKDRPNPFNAVNAPALSADFTDSLEEIKTTPADIFITKKTWNAFYNTTLHAELQKRNITGIVLAGVSTCAGVEGTARAASELAYNISFATDAMADTNPEAHHNSIHAIFPRLGEVGTSADIVEKVLALNHK